MSFHWQFNSSYNVNGRDLGIVFPIKLLLGKTTSYKMISFKALIATSWFIAYKDSHCPQARKLLCITLIRSSLLYYSTLWRPYLLKDIELLNTTKSQQIYPVSFRPQNLVNPDCLH